MSSLPPPVVYPNAVTAQPASHHSQGSFGPVFAVLAVVVVLSAIACIIGQICARRFSHPKQQQPKRDSHHHDARPTSHHHPKHPRKEPSFHHEEEEGDIEFGFKPRMTTGKSAGNGENRGPKHAENGEGEKRFAEEAKASAF